MLDHTSSIPMKPSEFLSILWLQHQGKGIQNLWTLPDSKTYNFECSTELSSIDDTVESLVQEGKAVYFQVGLQSQKWGTHKRGKEETTIAIPGFWHDTDIAGPGHKQPNLPQDLAAARDLIFSLPLPPTMIVHSGGGAYPLWLFKTPWELADDAEREKAKALSVRLQAFINAEGRKRGYTLDSTANLDRLLRIPGSLNVKDPANPRPVQVIHYEPAKRYTPDEIEQAFHPVAPSPTVAKKMTNKHMAKAPSGQFPLADFDKVKTNCAWVHHCVVDAASLPEPEWYAVVSIGGRCQDGPAKVHEISRPYPGYSVAETDKKIADALNNPGPRTCIDIRTNCGGETFCSACSHWGKVTSPILLGTTKAIGKVEVLAELAIPNAPVAEGTMIPALYNVSYAKGVWRYDEVGDTGKFIPIRVCPVPVVIVARSKDVNAGTEFVELGWFKDKQWNHRIVSRRTIADTREILVLTGFGLPVTSLSSKDLVRYLEDFEVANAEVTPLEKSSSHLGWQGDAAFLCGENLLVPTGSDVVDIVTFRAQDDGDAQIAKGFTTNGSLHDWLKMANSLYGFTKVFITVMSALSAPFLRVLEAANFVEDIAGETSKGKTITQVLAASSWGNPVQRLPNSVLNTWDGTDVWFERTAALLNGLPLMLDDTKTARSDDVIGDLVYRFTSGKGKGRGTPTGTSATGTWQSILISSGEQSIVDYAKRHGGVKARVLSLWGPPFGNGNQGSFVKNVEMLAKGNYGHAGPMVVQFILDHRDDWPLWRNAYIEMLWHFSVKAAGDSVAIRLSEILAFFAVTIPLIHAALPGLNPTRPISEVLEDLWPTVTQGAEQADKAKDAVKVLWDWAVANQTKFWGRHKNDTNGTPVEPLQGWAGRWDKQGVWKYLAVTRDMIERVLKGFEVQAMVKTWGDRGWLIKHKKGYQKSVRIGTAPCDVYVFKKETLSGILGFDLAEFDKRISDDEALR